MNEDSLREKRNDTIYGSTNLEEPPDTYFDS